ncbi:MAG TPA: hypothetical protein VFT89_07225 [Rhizobiaceae bacterium]|nr:hypothetical protein [Rhizobiaceae bacterium]
MNITDDMVERARNAYRAAHKPMRTMRLLTDDAKAMRAALEAALSTAPAESVNREMLEALKMAQLWLDVDGRYDMQAINAAIAKAEALDHG